MSLLSRRRRRRLVDVRPVGIGPLAEVIRYRLPADTLRRTLSEIAQAGAQGDELFVAWGARVEGGLAVIQSAIVPAQRCLHTPNGLLVVIDSNALFELNKELFERGEILAGQAHAHPRDAYHSRADEDLAIVTAPGGLSLVIPDFARRGQQTMNGWKWLRLGPDGAWTALPPEALELP